MSYVRFNQKVVTPCPICNDEGWEKVIPGHDVLMWRGEGSPPYCCTSCWYIYESAQGLMLYHGNCAGDGDDPPGMESYVLHNVPSAEEWEPPERCPMGLVAEGAVRAWIEEPQQREEEDAMTEETKAEEPDVQDDHESAEDRPGTSVSRVTTGQHQDGSPNHSVTGVATSGESDGPLEFEIPNLLPSDNATEVKEASVRRIKIPVRIEHLQIRCVDNGFVVMIRNAGRSTMFGPDGSEHVFSGDDAKERMMEFVGMVIGQVSYMYQEEIIDEDGEDVVL